MTETPLAEEQTYILEIEYNGLLSRNVSGLYYDSNADVDKADNLTLERWYESILSFYKLL